MIKKADNILIFLVGAESPGQRIDKFLTCKIKDTSRNHIQDLIGRGKVKVNGRGVNKHYRVAESDRVIVELDDREKPGTSLEPQKINLKVIYEDKYLLVISKEPGMLTHPVPGFNKNTLVNALLHYCNTLSNFSGKDRAGIVHRLDKDTSGLLIVAKDDRTHRLLLGKFKNREIKKTYRALVWGSFTEKRGEIILPIGRSRLDRKKMSISADRGKSAVTRFEVAEEFKDTALLCVSPETGRTHQIRVHLSYIDHPVIGDSIYGNRESKRRSRELGVNRQLLHAERLEFFHPVTREKMKIEDELPDDLSGCLRLLREEI